MCEGVPEQALAHSDDCDAEEKDERAQHSAGQATVPHVPGVAYPCTQISDIKKYFYIICNVTVVEQKVNGFRL